MGGKQRMKDEGEWQEKEVLRGRTYFGIEKM
jgi:hypothetical protein